MNLNDYYSPNLKKLNDIVKADGKKDHMIFNAPRSDAEIKQKMRDEYKILDPAPKETQNQAWNMRPRRKKFEIGP